ncbi:MAG: lipoprotein signal peptidase [Saprospiraceae bacterium]
MSRSIKVALIVILVLVLDQSLKIWVKTNMAYGDEIPLLGLDWAMLHFVENPGMAFGLKIGGDYGKLALSLFRILAVIFLFYFIYKLIQSKVSFGLLASFALILAGALGNIIDSALYGLIFSASPYHGDEVATLFPEAGGYAGFLHGKVVDMLYFPVVEGFFPEWFPFWGGDYFLFFRPVFNLADTAITIGVISILLFYRSFFGSDFSEEERPVDSMAGPSGEEPETTTTSEELTDNNNTTSSPSVSSTPTEDKP